MILIVEDNERLTRLLRVAFDQLKWRSHVAQNGVEAYRLVRQRELQCVLLDLRMPMLNGMDFLSIMKKDGINVPTIIMTGDAEFNLDSLKEFPNVVGFVGKPFEMSDMVEMVREHVSPPETSASDRLRSGRTVPPPHPGGPPKAFRRTWQK